MPIEDDAKRVLVALADFGPSDDDDERGRQSLEGDELVTMTGISANRVNDAVEVLDGRGLVETRRYMGTAPYDFGGVELTARGRAEAERIPRRKESPSSLPPTPQGQHDKALKLRRALLEDLYKLNTNSPNASAIWNADRDDPECMPRVREAEYLRAKGLVSGSIGGDGGLALKLTALGRDFVENGGFSQPQAPAADTAAPDTSRERRLPRLEVDYRDKLGSGAFGTVWRATDSLLEREIAVKFLTSTAESFDENALLREARSLAKVSHPNLVTVFAAAYLRHPESRLVAPAITMELLVGEPLEKWWSRQHEASEVFRVVAGVAAGVFAMHDAGLVHGDLHAENVMVVSDGTPKLIDWRYQDTFLMRSSAHRRNEIVAEQRRAIDLMITLLEKQGFNEESQSVRRMADLKAVVSTLRPLLLQDTQA